ncbi:MAG: ABC transporter permease [Proteobacteria bacterium]|nr:ABC transporter permease [Pseudomonadota bacterium]MBI3496975.1 ABC transporter permease [Pseudomonadota bacterium]
MLTFVIRRLGAMIIVMLLVASLAFIIARVVPGDPAAVMLGDMATPADVDKLRSELGLNRPLAIQFVIFLRNILAGNLGRSIFFDQPVAQAMLDRAELTLLLTALAVSIAMAIGVPIGIVAAVQRGKVSDQALTAGAMLAASLPSFWIGLTLIQYLSVDLRWFPVAGYGPPGSSLLERLQYLILPSFALGIPSSALIMRFTRSSMLDVLGEDYIRTARAKGLAEDRGILKHALRNAAIPILTVIGLTITVLMGGAIVTETVFALPGVGKLIVQAVLYRDYPVIQGALLVVSGIYVLINLAIDLLYAVLDPRIRY